MEKDLKIKGNITVEDEEFEDEFEDGWKSVYGVLVEHWYSSGKSLKELFIRAYCPYYFETMCGDCYKNCKDNFCYHVKDYITIQERCTRCWENYIDNFSKEEMRYHLSKTIMEEMSSFEKENESYIKRYDKKISRLHHLNFLNKKLIGQKIDKISKEQNKTRNKYTEGVEKYSAILKHVLELEKE